MPGSRRPARESGPVIAPIDFRNPRLARVGVDVVSCEHLRTRAAHTLHDPQRPEFFMLWAVESGHGTHRIDSVEHPVEPGRLIWVRPGQVQQWRMREDYAGPIVLFVPDALAVSGSRGHFERDPLRCEEWPPIVTCSDAAFCRVLALIGQLRGTVERYDGAEIAAEIVWHALRLMLLTLAKEAVQTGVGTVTRPGEMLYRRFLRAIEPRLADRPTVRELAEGIGCSQSTLTRACMAACGKTAKRVLDERIALEGKRLLLHSRLSAAEIALELGFAEPTNFFKFFRRISGRTPDAFRADIHRPIRRDP